MEPQEFMDKWGIDRVGLSQLLDLSMAQVDRWFFPATAKNYARPRKSQCDRLAEIDLILSMRAAMKADLDTMLSTVAARQAVINSEAMKRLDSIIPAQY